MLAFRHVVTYGTAQTSWLSNITDLGFARIGGQNLLFSATHIRGGVSSFSISDPDAPLTKIASRPYLKSFTYQSTPQLTVLELSGGAWLHLGQLGGAERLALATGQRGGVGGFQRLFRDADIAPGTSALGQFASGSGTYLFSGGASDLTLTVQRVMADGRLQLRSALDLPVRDAIEGASLDKIIEVTVGGQRLLVAISSLGNFISTLQLGDDGVLGAGATHVAAEGTGYYIPTDIAAVEVAGRTFLVVAGATSSSLTVFRLAADGKLTPTDHIIDELTTRFQSVTAMATAVVDGRAFIFVGGADDGISVLTLLPDGRLLHLTTIADDDAMTLADVSAIEAQVIDGKIAVFVGSASETGLTQLSFDPGSIGRTAMVGAGTITGGAANDMLVAQAGTTRLEGGAGDDILVTGKRSIMLIGGEGADTFVATRFDGRITIHDFEPGVDRLDLSLLGMIRSTWQLTLQPQGYGIRISYGKSIIDIRSSDGRSLAASDFGNDMFPVAHYLVPRLDPITVSPDKTPSTIGRWLFGTDGNDQLLGGAGGDYIAARGGNDTVSGGDGHDTILGEGGNDMLRGGNGRDRIEGGDGNDTIFGDAGNDRLSGDAGNDLIYGHSGDDLLSGGAGHDRLYGGDGNDRIFGDSGNDTLVGDAGDDHLEDRLGNNRLIGGAGRDTLIAGAGADWLYGGDGSDLIRGGGGKDRIHGEEGNDRLYGDSGDDIIRGGAGNDVIRGGSGRDRLYGGSGNDRIFGDGDNDTLKGDSGDDYLEDKRGSNLLHGGRGHDTLVAGAGADRLYGGSGNDLIRAGGGNDRIWGQSGNDRLLGRAGNDVINGGLGNDTLSGGAGNDYLVDKSGHNLLDGGSGRDTLVAGAGNDSLYGGSGRDLLKGGAGNDQLWGDSNHDRLMGGSGHDTLRGGAGNDLLQGQSGNDVLIGSIGNDTLEGGRGRDLLEGGRGRDLLLGGSGVDRLFGGSGADTLWGGEGNDRLFGDDGHDRLYGEAGNDRLDGGEGHDRLFGGSGRDRLLGQSGNDSLYGDSGADTLDGGRGRDLLVGGAGPDRMTGGIGADIFRYLEASDSGTGKRADLITDFLPGTDHLDLRALDLQYIGRRAFTDDHQLRWQHVGSETRVSVDLDGDGSADMTIRLAGTLTLDGDDFLL